MPSTPAVVPPTFNMSVTETLPLTFNVGPYLAQGQTPITPSAEIFDTIQGTKTAVTNAPSISGDVITQVIEGPLDLPNPDQQYLLIVNFEIQDTTTEWALELLIFAQQ